jgi:hypothetical protein
MPPYALMTCTGTTLPTLLLFALIHVPISLFLAFFVKDFKCRKGKQKPTDSHPIGYT